MTSSPESLVVRDLGVSVGRGRHRRELFSGVSLEIAPGEIRSWMGVSGVGKTTLLRALVGLHPRDRGEVRVGTRRIGAPARTTAGLVQMLFQDSAASLEPGRSALAAVSIAVAAARRRGAGSGSGRSVSAEAAEILERVGLARSAFDRTPEGLSAGERQRTAWARALASAPRFLLLDEPSTGLDPLLRRRLVDQLREEVRARTLGLLVVSHDGALVRALSTQVQVVRPGRIDAPLPWPNPGVGLPSDLEAWLDAGSSEEVGTPR
jgi:ABC-type dipeptide/oligopeptide/nickel transport system ATPase subunit